MDLVEPLRELFKDEVRAIGRHMGLASPRSSTASPSPAPASPCAAWARSPPSASPSCAKPTRSCTSEIEAAKAQHTDLWQYFAVLLPVKTVGVKGDAAHLRGVPAPCASSQSEDAMTADWAAAPARPPGPTISNRIMNEVRGINRVVLDISSKPPATIEWE